MGKKNNTGETNDQQPIAAPATAAGQAVRSKPTGNVDGIISAKTNQRLAPVMADPKVNPVVKHSGSPPAPTHSKIPSVSRPVAPTTLHVHAPQHSRTLMRHAVAKPLPGLKRRVKAYGPADALTKQPPASIVPKLSVQAIDLTRLKHAQHIAKSTLVKRFDSGIAVARQIGARPVHKPTGGRAIDIQRPSTSAHVPATTNTLLQHAVERATTHLEQPLQLKKGRLGTRFRRRRLRIGLSAIAIVAIAGVVGYTNVNTIRLHLASSVAGFSATLPDYKLVGYKLDTLSYGPGVVDIRYQSTVDHQSFAVIEKTSSWDSQTLLDSYVTESDQNYKAIDSAGRTIYLYGSNNATWVNNGVWYVVTSDGSLANRQLVDLANSL